MNHKREAGKAIQSEQLQKKQEGQSDDLPVFVEALFYSPKNASAS